MMLLQCKTVWDAAVSTLRFVTRSVPHKRDVTRPEKSLQFSCLILL